MTSKGKYSYIIDMKTTRKFQVAFCIFEIPDYSLSVVNTDGYLQRGDINMFGSEVHSIVHRNALPQEYQWYFFHYMRYYFLKANGIIEPKGYVV